MPSGIYKRIRGVNCGFWKGKHLSEGWKKKISEAKKGKPSWNKGKKREFSWWQGKKHTEETKRKMSKAKKGKFCGEKSYLWQGGISFEPYGLEFNNDLKEVIRNRDRRKCFICEKTELENKEKLTVHHIDYNKRNNDPKNLISLCRNCHRKTNINRNYWQNYFKGRI